MSKSSTVNFKCPKCGAAQEAQIFKNINVTLDANIKPKILNHSFFTHKCTACGVTIPMEYPTLYHDMKLKQMFYCLNNYTQKQIDDLNVMLEKTNAEKGAFSSDYTLRVVNNANGLIEKIKIFDNNKDDRIIELCKLVLIADLKQKQPDFKLSGIYYDNADGKDIFTVINSDGKYLAAVLPEVLYKKIEENFASKITDITKGRYFSVDAQWAYSKYNEKNTVII